MWPFTFVTKLCAPSHGLPVVDSMDSSINRKMIIKFPNYKRHLLNGLSSTIMSQFSDFMYLKNFIFSFLL